MYICNTIKDSEMDALNTSFVNYIFYKCSCYDERLRKIPQDDAKQQICLALLEASEEENFWKRVSKYLYELLCDYGYSRKKGKDKFEVNRLYPEPAEPDDYDLLLQEIIGYYATHTARETFEHFGLPFSHTAKRILCETYPKGMGRGGARQGAGNFKKRKFN